MYGMEKLWWRCLQRSPFISSRATVRERISGHDILSGRLFQLTLEQSEHLLVKLDTVWFFYRVSPNGSSCSSLRRNNMAASTRHDVRFCPSSIFFYPLILLLLWTQCTNTSCVSHTAWGWITVQMRVVSKVHLRIWGELGVTIIWACLL